MASDYSNNYRHPADTNLKSVHKAMDYNSLGQPIIRTAASDLPDSALIDAFGRQRFAQPYTLADYSHAYGQEEEMITETSGSGTTSNKPDQASIELSLGTGATDYVVHQSRQYHQYQPGKSQLVMMSFNFQTVRANTSKRLGYFDDRNGVFLQQAGDGTVSIVKRSYSSGAAVDTTIDQADWNINKLDGSEASAGITLDLTKSHLLIIDFQWLGVGRIRVGFAIGGAIVYCHEFLHSNVDTTVYWSNPALPVRCELRNTGTAVGTTTSLQTCATVMSEGGDQTTGASHSAVTSVGSYKSWSNGEIGKRQVILAVRLKNSIVSRPNRGLIKLNSYSLQSSSSSVILEMWRLTDSSRLSRSDSTAPTWVDVGGESIAQVCYDAQFIETDNLNYSFKTDSSFVAANNPSGKQAAGVSALGASIAKRDYIAQNYDSTDSQVWCLTATALTTTATNVWGSITWNEQK